MPHNEKDILNEAFGQIGHAPTGPSYAHPQQDEVIRDSVALLAEIPEGKRLISLIKEFDLTIRTVIGKIPNFFVPDGHTIVLVLPKSLVGLNPYEIACNLGLGIKEIELNIVNIQRLDGDPFTLNKKIIDIILEMCKIVGEFYDISGHTKLVDLVDKLGHGDVYKLYRSQADYKEMADLIGKSFKV